MKKVLLAAFALLLLGLGAALYFGFVSLNDLGISSSDNSVVEVVPVVEQKDDALPPPAPENPITTPEGKILSSPFNARPN